MRRVLFTDWLLWAGAALLVTATPALGRASCSHPTPRIAPSESTSRIAGRVRFISTDEAPARPLTPMQPPANPSRLPCLHCGSSLPSLPPLTATELGDTEALPLATTRCDVEPWRDAFPQSAPIYAFAPIDAIEHPPRAADQISN